MSPKHDQSSTLGEDSYNQDGSKIDQNDDSELLIIPETQDQRIPDSFDNDESQVIPVIDNNVKSKEVIEDTQYFQVCPDELTQDTAQSSQVIASQSILQNMSYQMNDDDDIQVQETQKEEITKTAKSTSIHEKSDLLFDDDSFDVPANAKDESKKYDIDEDDDETDCEEDNIIDSKKSGGSCPDVTIIEESNDDDNMTQKNEAIEPKVKNVISAESSDILEKESNNHQNINKPVKELILENSSDQNLSNENLFKGDEEIESKLNSIASEIEKNESMKVNVFDLQTQLFRKDDHVSTENESNNPSDSNKSVSGMYFFKN